MKKLLALLLALVMVLSLAACGASDSADTAEEPAAEEAAPAEETAEEAPAEEAAEAAYPEMTLTVSTSYNESESVGQEISYFFDYITEQSGGAIQFNVYWGGTFCSDTEDLAYVGNGSVDMSLLSLAQYPSELTLSNFPTFVSGSQQRANDYFHYIMFENEETASLLEDEWHANNIQALGTLPGGPTVFVTKTEMTSYKDMAGMLMGAVLDVSAMQEIGASASLVPPPNTYENLQKGINDGTYMTLDGAVAFAWYEVAPYFLIAGTYNCGSLMTVNLDTWNSFDEATQALFTEAMEYCIEQSTEMVLANEQANIDTVDSYNAEHGIDYQVHAQSDEDAEAYLAISAQFTAEECRSMAAEAGKTEQMETVLTACAEYLGMEF